MKTQQEQDDAKRREQVISRAARNIERIVVALTPEMIEEFGDLRLDLRVRLLDAIDQLNHRTGGLS